MGWRFPAAPCRSTGFASPQDYITNAPVVDAINDVLARLTQERDIGKYFRPPSWFTDTGAILSTEPDGSPLWETEFRLIREVERAGFVAFRLELRSI